MVTKSRIGDKTHFDDNFVTNHVLNAASLRNSLAARSEKRLDQYQSNLSVSRGQDKPLFDDRVMNLISPYVWNRQNFRRQIDYLNHLVDDDGFNFSRDLKIYSKAQPAFERFVERDHTSFRWNRNYQRALEELQDQFKYAQLRPLTYKSDDAVRKALPKSATHSGFTYILNGVKKKGDNMEGILSKFNSKLEDVFLNGSFQTPILIGFRTQASGEYGDDGSQTGKCKHKLRVVSMVDLLTIIAELKFSKPFQQLFSQTSMYAGGKDEREISKWLNYWRTKYNRFLSIDYSSYDQTISSWLIKDAFSIIKSAFKQLSPEDEVIFNAIVHDFIHKDFIINEGMVHSDKGVPSGSMFTQLVDSIVNILIAKTYFNAIGEECSMMAMGDDNIIFCRNTVQISEMATYVSRNFGMIVKVDEKSNMGNTVEDPKFLSRFWTNHGEWRHPNQLISRMAFPERFRNYSYDVTPAHVVTAFILTYSAGMQELMDVMRFMNDHPISQRDLFQKVDSRYLPGALAYAREYSRSKQTAV